MLMIHYLLFNLLKSKMLASSVHLSIFWEVLGRETASTCMCGHRSLIHGEL
jgi:hypothetical protein